MADGSFLGGHVNVLQLTDYSFLVVSDIRYRFEGESWFLFILIRLTLTAEKVDLFPEKVVHRKL